VPRVSACCGVDPQAVAKLTFQYRMNADIQLLSNTLVYRHSLKCGSDAVASSALTLPRALPSDLGYPGWVHAVLDPMCRVVFISTDSMGDFARETLNLSLGKSKGSTANISNTVEAAIVASVAAAAIACGLAGSEVGVIAPYRAHLRVLRQLLGSLDAVEVRAAALCRRCSASAHCVFIRCVDGQVETIDRYQGRDKGLILLSCVRSNASGDVREPCLAREC
jgi:DNA replication ATP-dependent helicase Dna2